MHIVLVLRPSVFPTEVGVNRKFPLGKKNDSVMEGSQTKSVKTKMRERKLINVVKLASSFGTKKA
jgi:hypothetical protein